MEKRFVYADNAATTQISKAALSAMSSFLEEYYYNPSSLYTPAKHVRVELENARATVAECIGAKPNEIFFTSCGSESDNTAVYSAAKLGAANGKKHMISTEFEHHAMLEPLKNLPKDYSVTLLKPDNGGIISPESLEKAITNNTCFASVMMVNNEIGTVQMVQWIGEICKQKKVIFHTDAVQAAGHIPIDVDLMNIDMLSMSGHKFHGPKGIGVLYIRNGIKHFPFIRGGKQERGYRAGTENVASAIGLATALKESCYSISKNTLKINKMRRKLIDSLTKIPSSRLNGNQDFSIPGTINMSFDGVEGEALLYLLDLQGICVSSGSACTAGSPDPSHVLKSIGLSNKLAHSSIRISIGEYNTMEDIDYMIKVIPEAVRKIRVASPEWNQKERT